MPIFAFVRVVWVCVADMILSCLMVVKYHFNYVFRFFSASKIKAQNKYLLPGEINHSSLLEISIKLMNFKINFNKDIFLTYLISWTRLSYASEVQ